MKKCGLAVLMAAVSILLLAGCASLYEADYYYSQEYTGDIAVDEVGGMEIRNMSMMKAALITMINSGQEHGQFKLSSYTGSPQDDLARVCYELKNDNPIGAFAVSDITVNTSRIVSYYVAEIDITYKRSIEEIKSIVTVSTAARFNELVQEALYGYQEELILKIYSSTVDIDYIEKLVSDCCMEEPLRPAVEPELNVTAYPEEGPNHIFEIDFSFAASPEKLDEMTEEAETAVINACAVLSGGTPGDLALGAVKYLSGLCTEEETLYGDTAYAALTAGSADSKAVALAFKAICDELGLECQIISGSLGAKAEQEHFWNILRLEDGYYHVDVSRFAEAAENSFLVSDERLWGQYVWDTESYPACTGGLDYFDFGEAGRPEEPEGAETTDEPRPEDQEEPQPEVQPTETPTPDGGEAPQPEETPAPEEPDDPGDEGNADN